MKESISNKVLLSSLRKDYSYYLYFIENSEKQISKKKVHFHYKSTKNFQAQGEIDTTIILV